MNRKWGWEKKKTNNFITIFYGDLHISIRSNFNIGSKYIQKNCKMYDISVEEYIKEYGEIDEGISA